MAALTGLVGAYGVRFKNRHIVKHGPRLHVIKFTSYRNKTIIYCTLKLSVISIDEETNYHAKKVLQNF